MDEIDISYESSEFMLPNKSKFTPLHYACKNGLLETVEILVKNDNININAIDDTGSTPLYYAVDRQDVAIIRLLIDNGADPLVRNSEGKSLFSHSKSKEINSILRDAVSNSGIFKKRKEIIKNANKNDIENKLNTNSNDENTLYDDTIKLDFSSSDNEEEKIVFRRDMQADIPYYNEFCEEEEEEEYMEMTENEENEFLAFKENIESKIMQMQVSMTSQIGEMVQMIQCILQKRNNLMKMAENRKSSKKA